MPTRFDEAIDESTPDGKLKAAAKKRNALAIANFTMAFKSETTMRLIYKAKSTAWPGGDAHEVVKALFKKYRPIDTMTLVELREALGQVSMKAKEDPATIFEQISTIENRYMDGARTIPIEELVAVVMSAAPNEYASVLTTEQRVKGAALTLEDLESTMDVHYRLLYPRNVSNDRQDDGEEIGLSAFNGVCFKCGANGHKANDCPVKKIVNSARNNFAGQKKQGAHKDKVCYGCGKKGHISSNCWEKESNASKRPSGWKSTKETGAVSADIGKNQVEFLLCGVPKMMFPTDISILFDPNVWVGDTGATTHQTCHDIGLTNKKEAKDSDAITLGNGVNEKAAKMADLPGVICNKEGHE
jgi:hypothetical protein